MKVFRQDFDALLSACMRRAPAIHPVLFAVFPVLFLFAHNQRDLDFRDLLKPLAAATLGAAAAWAIVSLLARDARRAALSVSLFVTMFFLYGHMYAISENWFVFGIYLGTPRFIFVSWCVLFTVGAHFCFKAKRALPHLTVALNLVSACLALMPAVSILGYQLERAGRGGRQEAGPAGIPAGGPPKIPDIRPDIYYIILDGYGRHDVLEEIYGYDNGAFLEFLRQRGFYVADASRANYCQTHLSLCSSLNLCHLYRISADAERDGFDRKPNSAMLKKSRAVQFLRGLGYTFVAFASGFSNTEMRDADIYVKPPGTPSEFGQLLLNMTPLPTLFYYELRHHQFSSHRRMVLSTLDQLGRLRKIPSPMFVFAHILAPHPPFVFGENGEAIDPGTAFGLLDGSHLRLGGEEYEAGYAPQVKYITSQLMKTVDQILSRSGGPPIIVLQGDHGPGSRLDYDDVGGTDIRERFSILNAYFLPYGGDAELYSEITPVNTFRVIFDYYFGAEMDLLPDESYFSTYGRPYDFVNVTDKAIGVSRRKAAGFAGAGRGE